MKTPYTEDDMERAMIDGYLKDAQAELKRRGISGALDGTDMRVLLKYRQEGRTGAQAGAQRAMDIIREN